MIDNADDRSTLPPTLLFFGKQLGPRPLFILDHSLPDPAMKLTSYLDTTAKTSVEHENTKPLYSNKQENSTNGDNNVNGSVNEE